MAKSLHDFGGRHAWVNDLLPFAHDVWSMTTVSAAGSAHADSNAGTSPTAKTADADGPTRTPSERDEQKR